MANINAPFGFRYAGRLDGSPPNAGLQQRQILSTNNAPIYFGDPVATSAGYIVQATAGANPIAGVFAGCSYLSSSQNRLIHSPWWPGVDAVAGSVNCLVISDPQALFLVQATGGPLTIADVDKNVQFTIGTGNQATGISGATANNPGAVTATHPFRMTGLVNTPMGTGGDLTTPFNWVYVTFNAESFKSLLAF